METYFEIIKLGMGDYSIYRLIWQLTIVAFCIIVTGIFSVADAYSGIRTAKAVGEKTRSHRYRKTIEKMTWYWFFQILVCIVGIILSVFTWYNLPYLSILLMLGICYIEGKSMWEHSKRRKDHVSKLDDVVHELVELIGGEDEARKIILSLIHKKTD